jgi:hypothetical protein
LLEIVLLNVSLGNRSESEELVTLVTFQKGIKLYKVEAIEKQSKEGNKQFKNTIYLREPFA